MITLDPGSLDDVLASIITVGQALGADDAARDLVLALQRRLEDLRSLLANAMRPPVLVLEWTDPPFSAGHWVPDVVSAGGGRTLLGRPGQDSQRVAWDAVKDTRADVVLVAPCGYHLDAAVELAEELVRANRLSSHAEVWAVDADSHFVRPGPRLVDGAEVVARILHPDLVGAPIPGESRQV